MFNAIRCSCRAWIRRSGEPRSGHVRAYHSLVPHQVFCRMHHHCIAHRARNAYSIMSFFGAVAARCWQFQPCAARRCDHEQSRLNKHAFAAKPLVVSNRCTWFQTTLFGKRGERCGEVTKLFVFVSAGTHRRLLGSIAREPFSTSSTVGAAMGAPVGLEPLGMQQLANANETFFLHSPFCGRSAKATRDGWKAQRQRTRKALAYST